MDGEGPIARNVRLWMNAKGLGQKALSLKAGLNETYVRDILKGRSLNPTQSRLQKLADALECRVRDLTGEVEGAAEKGSDAGRADWMAAYDALADQRDREALLRVAHGMRRDDPPTPTPQPIGRAPPDPPMGAGAAKSAGSLGCEKVVALRPVPA